jgi:hypothetical protein
MSKYYSNYKRTVVASMIACMYTFLAVFLFTLSRNFSPLNCFFLASAASIASAAIYFPVFRSSIEIDDKSIKMKRSTFVITRIDFENYRLEGEKKRFLNLFNINRLCAVPQSGKHLKPVYRSFLLFNDDEFGRIVKQLRRAQSKVQVQENLPLN